MPRKEIKVNHEAQQEYLARRGDIVKTCGRCGFSGAIKDNFGLKVKRYYTNRHGERVLRPTPCVECDAYCNTCNQKRRLKILHDKFESDPEYKAKSFERFREFLATKSNETQDEAIRKWRKRNTEKTRAHCIANPTIRNLN